MSAPNQQVLKSDIERNKKATENISSIIVKLEPECSKLDNKVDRTFLNPAIFVPTPNLPNPSRRSRKRKAKQLNFNRQSMSAENPGRKHSRCDGSKHLNIAILNGSHALNKMTHEQFDLFQDHLFSTVDAMDDMSIKKFTPRFLYSNLNDGILKAGCCDLATRHWLEERVPVWRPWPDACLSVINASDLSLMKELSVWIPTTNKLIDLDTILTRLKRQNKELMTEHWNVKEFELLSDGYKLSVEMEPWSYEALTGSMSMTAFYGMTRVYFKREPQRN